MRKEEKQESQLTMELQEPLSNKYYKVKNRFYFLSKYFEIRSYFRNPWVWGIIVLTITVIAIQVNFLQQYFEILPAKIPMLTMYLNLERRLFDKIYLIGFPAINILLLLVSIVAGSKVYYTNKILAIFTLALSLIASVVLTYGLIRIIAFYYI